MNEVKLDEIGEFIRGTIILAKSREGENFAEGNGEVSGVIYWGGKMKWGEEEEIGCEPDLDNNYLKGKTFSWKTTSLDKKQVLVTKSYNLYPLVPKG